MNHHVKTAARAVAVNYLNVETVHPVDNDDITGCADTAQKTILLQTTWQHSKTSLSEPGRQ